MQRSEPDHFRCGGMIRPIRAAGVWHQCPHQPSRVSPLAIHHGGVPRSPPTTCPWTSVTILTGPQPMALDILLSDPDRVPQALLHSLRPLTMPPGDGLLESALILRGEDVRTCYIYWTILFTFITYIRYLVTSPFCALDFVWQT